MKESNSLLLLRIANVCHTLCLVILIAAVCLSGCAKKQPQEQEADTPDYTEAEVADVSEGEAEPEEAPTAQTIKLQFSDLKICFNGVEVNLADQTLGEILDETGLTLSEESENKHNVSFGASVVLMDGDKPAIKADVLNHTGKETDVLNCNIINADNAEKGLDYISINGMHFCSDLGNSYIDVMHTLGFENAGDPDTKQDIGGGKTKLVWGDNNGDSAVITVTEYSKTNWLMTVKYPGTSVGVMIGYDGNSNARYQGINSIMITSSL